MRGGRTRQGYGSVGDGSGHLGLFQLCRIGDHVIGSLTICWSTPGVRYSVSSWRICWTPSCWGCHCGGGGGAAITAQSSALHDVAGDDGPIHQFCSRLITRAQVKLCQQKLHSTPSLVFN